MKSLYGMSWRCGPLGVRNCQIARNATMRTIQSRRVLWGCFTLDLAPRENRACETASVLRDHATGWAGRRFSWRNFVLFQPVRFCLSATRVGHKGHGGWNPESRL